MSGACPTHSPALPGGGTGGLSSHCRVSAPEGQGRVPVSSRAVLSPAGSEEGSDQLLNPGDWVTGKQWLPCLELAGRRASHVLCPARPGDQAEHCRASGPPCQGHLLPEQPPARLNQAFSCTRMSTAPAQFWPLRVGKPWVLAKAFGDHSALLSAAFLCWPLSFPASDAVTVALAGSPRMYPAH